MQSDGFRIITVAAVLFAAGISTAAAPSSEHSDFVIIGDTVSFAQQVMPIIERTCQSCHGGVGPDGEIVIEEGLDMTTYEKLMAGSTYGTVIEPGDPDDSYLVELIAAGDMPKEGDPLTPEEIELITQWIAAGAPNN